MIWFGDPVAVAADAAVAAGAVDDLVCGLGPSEGPGIVVPDLDPHGRLVGGEVVADDVYRQALVGLTVDLVEEVAEVAEVDGIGRRGEVEADDIADLVDQERVG
ncbi:hypothetical protein ACQB60_20420 [Actinomycetota bacterium Odt1-20B]